MCVPLLVVLSAAVLHSVSAGGVYCAKTARARAAALGLDYPGVHGGPDLYGQAHRGMHRSVTPFRPHNNNDAELDETEANAASYRQSQGVKSLDDRMHKQAPPGSRHGTYSPVQSEYTTDQVLSLPGGRPVINRESYSEEVKHVAPPTLAEAQGQPDLVNWDPQGRNELFSFVYNERDLVVDESVPNRRGMSLSGLPLTRSRGHAAHPWGPTGYSPGISEAPALASSGVANEARVRTVTGQHPAAGGPKRIRFPGHLTQPLHGRLNVKQFFQGNPALRHLMKSKIRSG